jgi:hypothetical protein
MLLFFLKPAIVISWDMMNNQKKLGGSLGNVSQNELNWTHFIGGFQMIGSKKDYRKTRYEMSLEGDRIRLIKKALPSILPATVDPQKNNLCL